MGEPSILETLRKMKEELDNMPTLIANPCDVPIGTVPGPNLVLSRHVKPGSAYVLDNKAIRDWEQSAGLSPIPPLLEDRGEGT